MFFDFFKKGKVKVSQKDSEKENSILEIDTAISNGDKMEQGIPEAYYGKIANHLDSIIPSEWCEIVMYGEELGDNATASFFFKTEEGCKYIASGKIPDLYKIDKNIYFNLIFELCDIMKQLKAEQVKQGMKEWKTIAFYLNRDYKFKVEYEYEISMDVGCYERNIYWSYNKLGIIPEDDFAREILNGYLKENHRETV